MPHPVRGVLAGALLALAGCGSSSGGPCAPRVPTDGTAPATLSEWCQVSVQQGEVTALAADVVPFQLTTPLFSDGAIKRRTVRLPPGTSGTYQDPAVFGFPDGTVFTKSFGFRADARDGTLPIRWIETRVEWKAAGSWNFMSYRWNPAASEAVALPGGEVVPIPFIDVDGIDQNASYLVPSQEQCQQCHSDGVVAPLGPKARFLNTAYPYPGGTENQLAHWTRVGILSGAPAPSSAPALPDAFDPDAGTLELRARTYLEANCGFCHSPEGNARISGLYLKASVSEPIQFGVCKHPVAAGAGAGGRPYDLVPGQPDQSIIPYRMSSTLPAVAMPQIGRSIVDAHGVALIAAWIGGLAGSCP